LGGFLAEKKNKREDRKLLRIELGLFFLLAEGISYIQKGSEACAHARTEGRMVENSNEGNFTQEEKKRQKIRRNALRILN